MVGVGAATLTTVAILLIATGAAIDVLSFVCGVRRICRGSGPSGVPVVALGAYAPGCLLLALGQGAEVGWPVGLGCAVFHVLFQFVLLIPLRVWR